MFGLLSFFLKVVMNLRSKGVDGQKTFRVGA